MGKPAQVGYAECRLSLVVLSRWRFSWLKRPTRDAIEAALKAKERLSGDVPKKIVAPVNDVVADQVSFVVLFDAVAL